MAFLSWDAAKGVLCYLKPAGREMTGHPVKFSGEDGPAGKSCLCNFTCRPRIQIQKSDEGFALQSSMTRLK